MNRELPRPGERYLHFKNKLYQILCIAEHTETEEQMVVYQALYGNFSCYVRPLRLFMEEVDHGKYPDVLQKYRFERVDDGKPQKVNKEAESLQERREVKAESEFARQDKASDKECIQQEKKQDLNVSQKNGEKAEDSIRLLQENGEEAQADPALLRFLDADTLEEKYQLLKSMEHSITERLIDDFSAVLDLVIPEGSLDYRYHQLLSSIGTMQRYENTRLR